jgi:putative ABC transport system permease protein
MIYLAWRNLSQSRIQFLLGIGGIMLALLLMLAIDAVLAGSEERLVAYIARSGADIFVTQEGVRNMHMAASAIRYRDMALASHAPGVTAASPILYTSGVIKVGGANFLSYIIGFDPDAPLGGPPVVIAGTNRLQRNEAIVDEAVARSQALGLGDEVEILGETFTVAGLTWNFTSIVNTVTFIRLADFQILRGGESISYALLQVAPGTDAEAIAEAITTRNDDVLALTRADFAREERQIVKDMSAEILNIIDLSAFLIGLAATALTLYTNTLRKRQEYGVLKAIGAANRHLYAVVVVQALVNLVLGFVVALGLVLALRQMLPLVVPNVSLTLTRAAMMRVLVTSLGIGVAAAWVPARQLARLDPARVFRG